MPWSFGMAWRCLSRPAAFQRFLTTKAFARSSPRKRDVQWLLPSHGPYFRKDDRLLEAVIARLQRYQHMADFGTCAAEWPLMDQWEQELAAGKRPN